MLPQTNISTTTTTTILDIPSKTYKLNIDKEDSNPYIIDNKDVVKFKIENGHLYALPQSPDCSVSFSITNGNLIAQSEDASILNKYFRLQYNVYFITNIYDNRIMGHVDRLEAIKQAIYKILMTERYAYLIYSENYGVELQQYIGKDFNYLEATIEQTLREALTYDLRIKDVEVYEITNNQDYANVKFNVYSIYGDLQLEVNISV